MPRVSEINSDGNNPMLASIFKKDQDTFGSLRNSTKVMAHCPPILVAARQLADAIEVSGQLPKAMLPLLYVRVATINACSFCIDINSARLAATEGGTEKLGEIINWRESNVFSAAERVALEYAERITITGGEVDEAFFNQLKAYFTDPQIVELTAAIAMENFRSKFNPAMGIEDQGFCILPTKPKLG